MRDRQDSGNKKTHLHERIAQKGLYQYAANVPVTSTLHRAEPIMPVWSESIRDRPSDDFFSHKEGGTMCTLPTRLAAGCLSPT
jgi:hypothetical protein